MPPTLRCSQRSQPCKQHTEDLQWAAGRLRQLWGSHQAGDISMFCSATLTSTDQQQSVPQHCPMFDRHHRMWPGQVSRLALFVTADEKQASRVQFSAGGRARSRGFKTISEQAAAFSVLALEKPTACKCLDICSTHTHMFLRVCGWVCDWVNVVSVAM